MQQGLIICCGGGVILQEQNIENLKRNGKIRLYTSLINTRINELNEQTQTALKEDAQLQTLVNNVQNLLKNYYAKKYFNETDEKKVESTKESLSERELYKLKVAIYKLESYVNLKKIEGKEAPSSKLSKIFDLKYNYNLKKSKYDKLFDYFAREETVKNLDIKKLEEEINKENDKVILRGEEISLGLLMEAITKEPSIILNPIINPNNRWGYPPDPFYLFKFGDYNIEYISDKGYFNQAGLLDDYVGRYVNDKFNEQAKANMENNKKEVPPQPGE